MSETVFIYALKEPDTGEIRYVGKARDPKKRLTGHLKDSFRFTNHRACWIRSVLSKDQKPILEILDEVPVEYWQQWEVAWIEFFREQGCRLVNTAKGGESGPGLFGRQHPGFGKPRPNEVRAKLRAANIGKKLSEEIKRKISLGGRGQKRTEETRRKISAALKGRKYNRVISPETRDKLRTFLGKKHSPESREKIGAAQRGRKFSLERCLAIREGIRKRKERLAYAS